jgi:hypothetical protein
VLRPAEAATGALVARSAGFLSRGADTAPRTDFYFFILFFIFHVLPASYRVVPIPLPDLLIYLFIYLIICLFIYSLIARFACFLSRGADAAPRTDFCFVLFYFIFHVLPASCRVAPMPLPDLSCSGIFF